MTTTVIFRTIGPSYIQTTTEMRSPPLIQDRIEGFLYAIGGEKGKKKIFSRCKLVLILEWCTYWDNRERADEIFIDYEQSSSVVKLTTVVRSTKHCHQLNTQSHIHSAYKHQWTHIQYMYILYNKIKMSTCHIMLLLCKHWIKYLKICVTTLFITGKRIKNTKLILKISWR